MKNRREKLDESSWKEWNIDKQLEIFKSVSLIPLIIVREAFDKQHEELKSRGALLFETKRVYFPVEMREAIEKARKVFGIHFYELADENAVTQLTEELKKFLREKVDMKC